MIPLTYALQGLAVLIASSAALLLGVNIKFGNVGFAIVDAILLAINIGLFIAHAEIRARWQRRS